MAFTAPKALRSMQAYDRADGREGAAMNRRGAEPRKSGQMLVDRIALVLRKAMSGYSLSSP